MKKLTLVIALIMLVSFLSIPAYASSDNDSGGGFLSGLWNSMRWLGDKIGSLFSGAANFILDGLKYLFIPREDFFTEAFAKIHDTFESKFGNLNAASDRVRDVFDNIAPNNGLKDAFTLKFPAGSLFQGLRVNLFPTETYNPLPFVRNVFSGLMVIMTFAFAYRRVIGIINS